MATYPERSARSAATPLLGLAAVTASLYLAREVLIPLALAVLFSALLAPAVRRLEALRIGRTAAALVSVALFVAALVVVGIAAGNQVLSLAGKLPDYRENIAKKLRALHSPPQGELGKAARAIQELEGEAAQSAPKPAPKAEKKPAQEKPAAVPAVPTTPLEAIGTLGFPLLTLAAMAAAVLVLTTLMLLKKDDLRDRLIRLVGQGRIQITTQALEDAAGRVSRYLLMQLVVNVCYAVPLAIALHLIGLPNALLFGLLATVLRFIPYVGAAIAAAMPIALAFAISEGWETIAWTAGSIGVLEFTVAYVIEPWLYGESTGLSPIAIVFSAIFWTWLWGPIGLLLATPMTVCISVVGRYLPQLRFLHVILGTEPVLPPPARFYQRLVAMEFEEAVDLAEEHVKAHGVEAFYEDMLVPALVLAKRDLQRDALDERHERFVMESLLRVVDEAPAQPGRAGAPVAIVPVRGEPDFVAGAVLARLLAPEPVDARLAPKDMLASEALERCDGCRVVVLSAVPPQAVLNAAYLCKRVRARYPQAKIIVALWRANGEIERLEARLRDAGADEVVTTLRAAVEKVRLFAPPAPG